MVRPVKIVLRKICMPAGTERRACALYKVELTSHIRGEVTNEMPMNGGDMVAAVRLAGKVAFDAYSHFAEDDGWAMASHMALSILLALFPFLIFGTALAGFLGADQFSETAVHLIFDTWPEAIAGPLAAQVQQVLTIPRGGLLTISVLAAAYFASNGVEALRISLNRAYRVTETRWWYITRLLSLLYVLIAVVVFTGISIVLVAVPVATSFAEQRFPWLTDALNTVSSLGLYGTIVVLTVGLVAAHLWLPAGKRRIWDVWPGILLTMIFWVIGAAIFAYYLSTFANYAATYAGLASVMVVLVFLYMVGVIFMLGAEVNAALMKYKVRQIIRRNISGNSARREQVLEEPDKPADI
jgi:membrane protein